MIEATGGGLLFEPGNPGSLADAIMSLWRDRDGAREMGRRGALGVARHYGAAQMAERALLVYQHRARKAPAAAPA
jgi:hypothetical protein